MFTTIAVSPATTKIGGKICELRISIMRSFVQPHWMRGFYRLVRENGVLTCFKHVKKDFSHTVSQNSYVSVSLT